MELEPGVDNSAGAGVRRAEIEILQAVRIQVR